MRYKRVGSCIAVMFMFSYGAHHASGCVEQPDESCCYDFWTTPAGQSEASFATIPIPAGFFESVTGSPSLQFGGDVPLAGVPFGADGDPHTPSTADTVVWRDHDPDVCCPGSSQEIVAVRLYALSMASTTPVQIQYEDRPTEAWDMTVGLSCLVIQPVGTLTAFHGDCTGGTFNSSFDIYPRFVFTRVSDNAEVVLDNGAGGGMTLAANSVPFLCQLPPSTPGGPSGPDGFFPGHGDHAKGGQHVVDPCYSCYPRPNPCHGQADPFQFTTKCKNFIAVLEEEFQKVAK